MTYIDLREERERICAETGCDPFDAQELIEERLEEGTYYWPLRWNPNPGPRPPRGGKLWRRGRTLIGWDNTCAVYDDFDLVTWERWDPSSDEPEPRSRMPQWRVLMLPRQTASEAEAAPQHEPVIVPKAPDESSGGALDLDGAIEAVCSECGEPAKKVPWDKFCPLVRQKLGVTDKVRGYGDQTIKNRYRKIRSAK